MDVSLCSHWKKSYSIIHREREICGRDIKILCEQWFSLLFFFTSSSRQQRNRDWEIIYIGSLAMKLAVLHRCSLSFVAYQQGTGWPQTCQCDSRRMYCTSGQNWLVTKWQSVRRGDSKPINSGLPLTLHSRTGGDAQSGQSCTDSIALQRWPLNIFWNAGGAASRCGLRVIQGQTMEYLQREMYFSFVSHFNYFIF